MKMKLDNLPYSSGSIKKNKRIGRGQGSGKGGTSTKGHKGAKSRSGFSKKIGFEGGQLPLQRRIPKFGFRKYTRKTYLCINIELLQVYVKKRILFKEITPDILIKTRTICISKHKFIKIIGIRPLDFELKVSAHKFSQSSVKSIKNAGGEAIRILS